MSEISEDIDILGIDFGTTNSKTAFLLLGTPELIPSVDGDPVTPSVVFFHEDGSVLVGKEAKRALLVHPDRTVYSVKRYMGTDHRFMIESEEFPPEYIGGHIFRQLRSQAESYTGRTFSHAVVSVPANFPDSQRQAIKDAAEIGGLTVIRMINEPTAAALAYGIREKDEEASDLRLLVYDFGGGTFDVSVLTVSEGFFDVDATSGENRCGGDDIDQRIAESIENQLQKKLRIKPQKDLALRQTIREAAELAKIKLSTAEETTINLPFVGQDKKGKSLAFSTKLTRRELNHMIQDIVEKTRQPMEQVLDDASLEKADIDAVLLVGGTSKIPFVQDFVKDFFEGKQLVSGVDPYEAVALGAAVASDFSRKEGTRRLKNVEIADVTSHSLGIYVMNLGGSIAHILERNTKIPITKKRGPFVNNVGFTDRLQVSVYQGESPLPYEDEHLGDLLIEVEPKPQWQNRIEVTFKIGDEFGILEVVARDMDTGLKRSVRMVTTSRLTHEEKKYWMEQLVGQAPISFYVVDITTDNSILLTLPPKTKIAELRQLLRDKKILATPSELSRVKFYFQDRKLADNKTLSDYIIKDWDLVEVALQKEKKKRRKT